MERSSKLAGHEASKPKESKKDRHMKCLSTLAKFLEVTNEETIQKVLLLKRQVRETLETFDEDLEKYCKSIDEKAFLIDKSEDEVMDTLACLQGKLNKRCQLINDLATDLDQTELKQVDGVGVELKNLVDRLVAIAYQLPDDIERLVATEAFEVNQEVIANRVTHTKAVGELKVNHIRLEAGLIRRWEGTKAKWRQIRHEKALEDYRSDIRSAYFNDPEDRKAFMNRFRQGQSNRREEVSKQVGILLSQNYSTIVSATIADVQLAFNQCNEVEGEAIQACYNGLTQLRNDADFRAKERMEAIRKELHLYGALKVNPKLHLLADQLEPALESESLAELWRLGGGLKPDVQTLLSELRCEEIVYDRVIVSMKDKLDFIIASFPLKGVLEERGRLSQLDKVKGLVTKMRSAPRAEIAGVMRSLVSELEDIAGMEQLSGIFSNTLREIAAETHAELANYETKLKATALGSAATHAAIPAGTTKPLDTGTLGNTSKTVGFGATKTKKVEKDGVSVYVDPILVKGWHKRLATLFYGPDLPEQHQTLLCQILVQVEVQSECNVLVDEVIKTESDDLLRRMDRRYQKLTDSIVSYLEAQAMLIFTQSTNLCSFYTRLAKLIETHRAEQKALDDKSTEELWDTKEEYRIALEDREGEYEAACQKMRECTKQEQINEHFEEVIVVLDKIQQTYRDYHKYACFAADKYPLWLIDEFRGCMVNICKLLFMQPNTDHPVLLEYDRIFDTVVRFNSDFFDTNPNAANVERTANAELDPSTVAEAYVSPYGTADPSSVIAYVGKYSLTTAPSQVFCNFSIDGYFADKAKPESETNVDEGSEALRALTASKIIPHTACPWMRSTATALPIDSSALEAMDIEDREEYETQLAKHFVALVDDLPPADAPVVAAPAGKKVAAPVVPPVSVITPGVFPTLSLLSLEDRAKYAAVKDLVYKIKARIEEQSSAEFILKNVPRDTHQQPWVQQLEVTVEEISQLYKNIRHNVIGCLEAESFKKMIGTERQMTVLKTELTDQLEDRIRNHWPRRGRVETEIKQPREKELLGHKDKTYRLILAIQNKVIELQAKYTAYLADSRGACDLLVQEMTSLRNSLTGNFKNLASLQGLDVKARGTALDFQADCGHRCQDLTKLSTVDVDAIVAYARDFRRICPLQKPGIEGGYSEQELQEIHDLMEAQCADMSTVKDLWNQDIQQLSEQQKQSMLCHDEFNAKYAKCTQEVAMAEGLGQKYGAPRRRAQERIRSEVSRDERAAGKVDEFLALIEFVCSEMAVHENASKSGDVPSVSESTSTVMTRKSPNKTTTLATASVASPAPPDNNPGIDSFNRMQFMWKLMQSLRIALIARAKFLDILADKGFVETASTSLHWLDEGRLRAAAVTVIGSDPTATAHAVPSLEDNVVPGQAAAMATIHAVFEDVSAICKKETKQLYESEGLGTTIPASLEQWLAEAKDKLIGRHGYQERAWKRLWAQAQRLDQLMSRPKTNDEEGDGAALESPAVPPATNTVSLLQPPSTTLPAVKLSVQGVCLLSLAQVHMALSTKHFKQQVAQFAELLAVWELGRDKHERLLKPRLGSPDKADELAALDKMESDRSQDMQGGVASFRCLLIRAQAERFRQFCEDLGQASKGLIVMLDTCLRQELLAIPPDTAVPKKHMTLKKLRKAQRIRDDVAKGKEDISQRRLWSGIELTAETVGVVIAAEDMVPDLGSQPSDTTGVSEAEAAAAAASAAPVGGKDGKDKKAAAPKKPDKNAPPPVTGKPSLLPLPWIDKLKESTAVQGLVSSAHRSVMQYRDEGLSTYLTHLGDLLATVRADYGLVLHQEHSWTQRWKRQVDMLREGKL